MRDTAERLRDILDAIMAIERHALPDRASFAQDELVQVWCLRHFQIIGEAVRALPEAVRVLAPAVPWPKIIGMRNVLVHGYFDIDTDVVWDAVSRDIPALKPEIEHVLASLENTK